MLLQLILAEKSRVSIDFDTFAGEFAESERVSEETIFQRSQGSAPLSVRAYFIIFLSSLTFFISF